MIIFLGPPGSGKGTQAGLLKKNYNISTVSVGDCLRAEVKKQTQIGKKIDQCLKQGKLVETGLIIDLIGEYLVCDNIILDGFPRNIEQAHALDKIKSEYVIFDFKIPTDLLMERLENRIICANCNSGNKKNDIYCKFCNSNLKSHYKRDDDNNQTINERIKIYEEEHYKLIKHYSTSENYLSINANDTIEEIYKYIRTCLIKKSLI